MADQSSLDKKYFIDSQVYNCPFCNRRNVMYYTMSDQVFDWSNEKKCYAHFVKCTSCGKTSMHLSYDLESGYQFRNVDDIDSKIFYSVPTSFFVIDNRIPKVLRELISEADGCLKMNYLTGASACTRKAIYVLLSIEKSEGQHYEDKIKSLKGKYMDIDPTYFDILSHIQDMTSDKIHEQSWDKWDSENLKLLIENLKSIFQELYVVPKEKSERANVILKLKEELAKSKK